ncbi:MAG: hypothetical protein Q9209_007314 [Squamulea sp. 1 TL-2023]
MFGFQNYFFTVLQLSPQCLITARPTTDPSVYSWEDSFAQDHLSTDSTDLKFVSSKPELSLYSDHQYNSLLTRRASQQRTRLGDRYHVPNTDTTLLMEWGPSSKGILAPVRELISHALTEVENIIDIAGDGVIPGDRNEYVKMQLFRRGAELEGVSFGIWGYWNPDRQEGSLTYKITLDVLRGLWATSVIPKREQVVRGIRVLHGGKLVAIAVMTFAFRPHLETM